MEIKAYLGLIWRWFWLITLAALLSGTLAYIVSGQIPPTYEASTIVTVARRVAADSEYTPLSERPTATYVELLRKRTVLDEVISRLGLNVDSRTLERQLRVGVIRDTALIRVTVSDRDPGRATAIASALVDLVSMRGHELLGNDVTIRRYSLHVIDPAQVASLPVSPTIPLNVAVMAVIGALLTLGGVLIWAQFDDRVQSAEAIQALTGITTLATIPHQGIARMQGRPIAARDERDPVVEMYRMLRVHIEHLATSRPLHTLLVLSATRGEGKSTTVANLAIVLARAGRQVILVDGDLRRPSLHTLFRQSNERGVTTALTNATTESLESYLMPTGIANLRLMPSGPLPANPAELLGSPQMRQLIEQLSASGAMILIDSPALLEVVDAITLARFCDATLLVARAGATRSGTLVTALERLAQFDVRPLGVVLNGGSRSRSYATQRVGEPAPAAIEL
jgi:capsular exopolysaccharide synthesis family protein